MAQTDYGRVRRSNVVTGAYRVFNQAVYRAYRSNANPPAEGDEPIGTSPTLPFTPDVTFDDDLWLLSLSWFNGIYDSGLLPLNSLGRTYLELEISGGTDKARPPAGPALELLGRPGEWTARDIAGGIVRVEATYREQGTLAATHWVLTYTTDNSAPLPAPETGGTQTRVTVEMNIGSSFHPLEYDLPAQGDGTIVKLILQMGRLDDETWYYSEGGEILAVPVATAGPAAPV